MCAKPLEDLIIVASQKRPAELVIKNAKIFNSFTGEFTLGDLAIEKGFVAGVGSYQGLSEVEAQGGYLLPGLMDSHVHIESAMAAPMEFAKTIAALGTSTIIADPHEIANVAGTAGLEYILDATEDLPINVFIMLPSCVPATSLEWGGAKLTHEDLAPFLAHPRVLGLGEMMDYPGVVATDPEIMAKLKMADGYLIDGHSPSFTGPALTAYAAAGIRSDHECMTPAEARERLALGMAVMLRQGSAAKNLLNLLPAVDNEVAPFCLLATDDRHPEDLIAEGHINYLLRLAVSSGLLPLSTIIKMGTINGARHYGLTDIGALTPGYRADFALYPNLVDFRPLKVWKDGRLIAENGQCLWQPKKIPGDSLIRNRIKMPVIGRENLQIKADGPNVRVIELVPGELLTNHLILELPVQNGLYEADPAHDLIKLAVIERHRQSGHIGLGFLKGLGLQKGAVASTVAHDSHNLVVAGATDDDMLLAIEEIRKIGGGLVMVADGQVQGSLPLPLGGLLSDKPMLEIKDILRRMQDGVRALGLSPGHDPFMTLAFMSLPVIPHLKLTEMGLVDVDKFQIVPTVF